MSSLLLRELTAFWCALRSTASLLDTLLQLSGTTRVAKLAGSLNYVSVGISGATGWLQRFVFTRTFDFRQHSLTLADLVSFARKQTRPQFRNPLISSCYYQCCSASLRTWDREGGFERDQRACTRHHEVLPSSLRQDG